MLAHFVYDGLIIVLVYFNPEMLLEPNKPMLQASNLVIAAALSLAATLFILWQMKKNSKTSYEEIYRDDHPPRDQFTF